MGRGLGRGRAGTPALPCRADRSSELLLFAVSEVAGRDWTAVWMTVRVLEGVARLSTPGPARLTAPGN